MPKKMEGGPVCSRSYLPNRRVKRSNSNEYRLYFHQKQETEAQSFCGLEWTMREKRILPGDLSRKKPELTIR